MNPGNEAAIPPTTDLSPKERHGRGLGALATGLRPYVEAKMAAAIPAADWVTAYEAKETGRRGRTFRVTLTDPRLLLQMIRYERAAFTDVDASQRAWLEELIQSANRAAHTTSLSSRETDRALDTMLLLAESLDITSAVPSLIELRVSSEAAGAEPAGTDSEISVDPEVSAVQEVTPEQLHQELPAGVRALSLRAAGLAITVIYQEAVNLALTHNGVSPIRSVRIVNESDQSIDVEQFHLTIDSPTAAADIPTGTPLDVTVGEVEPGAIFEVGATGLSMLFNPAVFLALDEAAPTSVRLNASVDQRELTVSGPIRLLAADEWWATGIPELLAAFVRPNDPALVEVLQATAQILETRTGSRSIDGYQSGPLRAQQIAEAVYETLVDRRLTYIEPPASFEGTGQRIRTHAQVLTDGFGTCIDLACLYAAALEQAGLPPILAIFQGHALTGYLTEAEQLPSVVVAERGTAITIADSDFFDAVELTAVCASEKVPFDDARQQTSHWWSTDIDKLRFLLDVYAAHHRVKPLPTIRLDGDIRVIESVRTSEWEPARRSPARTRARSRRAVSPSDKPTRVVRWERALLDMTYANPLLKRKPGTSLTLHIPSGSLAGFEDRVADGNPFALVAHDEIDQIHRAQGARSAADVDPAALRTILERERRLFVAVAERDYARRLRTLVRRSKTAIEETGSDNLYLTLGSLQWAEGGRRGDAPLFLVPVKMSGGHGVHGFSLAYDDSRERVANYCLIEKLRVAFSLEVPEFEIPDLDESGVDVGAALAALRTAILQTKNTAGFHVEETAYLALLQFSTLELWQDLRANWTQFVTTPAIKHLVDNPGSVFSDGVAPPEPRAKDEAETFLPIPADGSQIEAVRWAAAGKTFILEGPPGTGKSQTITNLIAHNIANGKRVLFVAEKAAALDVVRRRLDEIGIGVFCLDLHGRTQTVSAVRDQLRRALEEHATPEPGWQSVQSTYEGLAVRLADYPNRLHRPGPFGLSAWDARQLVLEQIELNVEGEAAVEVPQSVVLSDVQPADLYAQARDLGNNITDLGGRPADSPWRLAGGVDPDRLDRQGVARTIAELSEAASAVSRTDRLEVLLAPFSEDDQFEAAASWLDTLVFEPWPPRVAAELATPLWNE